MTHIIASFLVGLAAIVLTVIVIILGLSVLALIGTAFCKSWESLKDRVITGATVILFILFVVFICNMVLMVWPKG